MHGKFSIELHFTKNESFALRIYPVNVTKSWFAEEILDGKLRILYSANFRGVFRHLANISDEAF